MVRKLAAALLGVGVFIPGLANALGLGEIKLNSALSEPLDAEIELVQVRELTATEILPSLATNADFESSGVERSQFLSDLRFEVQVNDKGKSYIHVRSNKPVKEPFLNFLVEVNWPAGRLLREYTLFLDPPVYSAQRTQAVTPAAAPAPRASARPAAAASSGNASAPRAQATPAPQASGDGTAGSIEASAGSHTIGANDSLWGIASKMRPSSDVSVHQTMIALQQVNPDAFIDDNINLLKKGQVLRAPTVEEARQISNREAIERVAEQNRLWRDRVAGRKSAAPAAEAAQIDLTGRSLDEEPAPAPTSGEDGRLKLLSGAGADAESGKGGDAQSGGGELRDKLAVAEENVDRFKLENEDLKVKMNDLSDQLKTSEKVISLKDQQIAALQAKLNEMDQKAREAEAAAPGQSAAETVPPVEAAAGSTESAPADVAPVSAEIDEPVVPAAEPAQAEVDFNYQQDAQGVQESPVAEPESQAPAAETATAETSGAEAPVAAEPVAAESAPEAAVAEPEPAVVMDEKPVVMEEPAPVAPLPVQAPAPAASGDLVSQLISNPLYLGLGAGAIILALIGGLVAMRKKKEESDIDSALMQDFELPENTDAEPVDEAEMDFEEAASELEDIHEPAREETVPQTTDVIGEADIYIAYGRYPQAIEMLQKAAQNEPGRADIRLKLCEVCVEARDSQTFMTHYQALQTLGDAGALRRAEDLRSRINLAVPVASPTDETLVAQPLDSNDLDFDVADNAAVEPVDLEPESDTGLDFDLGDLEDTGARFAESAPVVEAALDSGLDFDLDLETPAAEPVARAGDDNSLDFDFSMDDALPAVAEAPVAAPDADHNALDFDTEFSLDSVEGSTDVAAASTAFDEDLSLDFDHVETTRTAAPVAEDAGLDFDLEFDTGAVEAGEGTIAFTPSTLAAPAPAPGADEPLLDSQSAAQLASELDLDGDFLSHDDDLTIQAPVPGSGDLTLKAPALEGGDLTLPATPAVSASLAANDLAGAGDELDFLADADEASTKLDLARAYIDMGDREGARDILDEVMIEGSDTQKQEAKELLNRLEA